LVAGFLFVFGFFAVFFGAFRLVGFFFLADFPFALPFTYFPDFLPPGIF